MERTIFLFITDMPAILFWKWLPVNLDSYFGRSGTNPGAINHCEQIFIAIRFTTDTAAPSVVA